MWLKVFAGGVHTTHVLPASGRVVLGRGEGCDVRIEDASVSRRHASLEIGPDLWVEDLGSANGTRVGSSSGPIDRTERTAGSGIVPGKRARLTPGEPLWLGSVLVTVQRPEATDVVVGEPAMKRLHELAIKVAAGPISVLLLGETGVGKEVLAQVIHTASPRASGPFVGINCGALTETLLESELFGHEKGAFTGAVAAKPGLLEAASGGTVFLDEVGEMPPTTQVKLLRAIEAREITRVGGLSPRPIDVRFIAATNRDLEAEAQSGRFRPDLFFRLNGLSLRIPPLRERPSEVEQLARRFAARAASQMGLARAPELSPEALSALKAHPWPGNVRELKNVMERATVLASGPVISPEHLQLGPATRHPSGDRPQSLAGASGQAPGPTTGERGSLRDDIERLERERIVEALARCGGNQTQAAKELGISRRTLVSRLGDLGLPRPRKR